MRENNYAGKINADLDEEVWKFLDLMSTEQWEQKVTIYEHEFVQPVVKKKLGIDREHERRRVGGAQGFTHITLFIFSYLASVNGLRRNKWNVYVNEMNDDH